MFASFLIRGASINDHQYNIDHYKDEQKKALSVDFKERCTGIWKRFETISNVLAGVAVAPLALGSVLVLFSPAAGAACMVASLALVIFTLTRGSLASSQAIGWEFEWERSSLETHGTVSPLIAKCRKFHYDFKIADMVSWYEMKDFFAKNPMNEIVRDMSKSILMKSRPDDMAVVKLSPFVSRYMDLKSIHQKFMIECNHQEEMVEMDLESSLESVSLQVQRLNSFCKTQRSFAEHYNQMEKKAIALGQKGGKLIPQIEEGKKSVVSEEGLQFLENSINEFASKQTTRIQAWASAAKQEFSASKEAYLNGAFLKAIKNLKDAFAKGDGQSIDQTKLLPFEYKRKAIPEEKFKVAENLELGITAQVLAKLNQ